MNSRGVFIVFVCVMLATAGCSRSDFGATGSTVQIVANGSQQGTPLQSLLEKLAHAPESDLATLVYGYDRSSTGAQKILLNMLKQLHAPSPDQNMTVETIAQSGHFRMVVAQIPWLKGTQGSTQMPILLTSVNGVEVVVGYVLPFDDLIPLLAETDLADTYKLAGWWATRHSGGA